MVLWFYVQEHLKAQLAVVLVLKRLKRRGNGLKSYPTDWEKRGIEPNAEKLRLFCFQTLRCCIYHAIYVKMPTFVGILTFLAG